MSTKITINKEQRLFVISSGAGTSCFGFDNCLRDSQAMASAMKMIPPSAGLLGTLEGYEAYQQLLRQFAQHPATKATWFTPGTPDKVKQVLAAANKSFNQYGTNGTIVRIFLGDQVTGRDWCEENDVVGYVGRTSGTMKVPILLEPLILHKSLCAAQCGDAIPTNCILRIIDVVAGAELYRAAHYQLPTFEIVRDDSDTTHPFKVKRDGRDGTVCAGCKTYEEACRFVAFAMGTRPAHAYRNQSEYWDEMREAA